MDDMLLSVEDKKKWVKALRSGSFEQSRNQLHSQASGGYCCLGVKLAVCDGFTPATNGDSFNEVTDSAAYGMLDRQIGYENRAELVGMNDGSKTRSTPADFAEIADWIEENL